MKLANETFNRFDVERWIIKRIGQVAHPCEESFQIRAMIRAAITEGRTDFNIRKVRIAAQIQKFNLADRPIGKGTETFAQCFERFYGEPLSTVSSGESA